jgi:hypothetical protein
MVKGKTIAESLEIDWAMDGEPLGEVSPEDDCAFGSDLIYVFTSLYRDTLIGQIWQVMKAIERAAEQSLHSRRR